MGYTGQFGKKLYQRNTSELDECKNIQNFQIQKAQQTPNRLKKKKGKARYVMVSLLKTKDKGKILKAARAKCQAT